MQYQYSKAGSQPESSTMSTAAGPTLEGENSAQLEAAGLGATSQPSYGLSEYGQAADEAVRDVHLDAIPNRDIVYEQLAHNFGYCDDLTPTLLSDLMALGFAPGEFHSDTNTGFAMRAFVPMPGAELAEGVEPPTRAVVAFRGTEPSDLMDVITDMDPVGVGYLQFEANQGKIAEIMGALASPDVVGHSLGGALAQLAACRIGGVGSIVTFQAPGIAQADVELLDEGVESTHYRVKGDVVDNAGEAHTDGTVVELDTVGVDGPEGHIDYPLAAVGKDRGMGGLHGNGTEIEDVLVTDTEHDDQKFEDIRGDAGEVYRDLEELTRIVSDALENGLDAVGSRDALLSLGFDVGELAAEFAEQLSVLIGDLDEASHPAIAEQLEAMLSAAGVPDWIAGPLATAGATAILEGLDLDERMAS